MAKIEKSVDVNVPVTTAYNQWTQFEEFPRFMEGVKEVRQLDDKRLYWRAEIAGKEKEWNAEISDQVPDQRIAWHSTTGAQNAGRVSFQNVGSNKTRVTLQMDYDPEGVVEGVGDMLGVVSSRVQGDLERFKEYIETRGSETGAWRGEIHGNETRGGATGTSGKTGSMGTSGTTGTATGSSGVGSTGTGTPGRTNVGTTGTGTGGFGTSGSSKVGSTSGTTGGTMGSTGGTTGVTGGTTGLGTSATGSSGVLPTGTTGGPTGIGGTTSRGMSGTPGIGGEPGTGSDLPGGGTKTGREPGSFGGSSGPTGSAGTRESREKGPRDRDTDQ